MQPYSCLYRHTLSATQAFNLQVTME
uniref:Uncharacterized protein n=1 Tax=Rhizophora mucronata TaxID=61149 RepID=A0A2P2NB33_RHIMU